jgi:glycosyltransferase involved in cell wall biosynthesis
VLTAEPFAPTVEAVSDAAAVCPRVLMVLKRPAGPGGMQKQARRVSRAMRRLGVPVRLVCHTRRRAPTHPWARYLPVRYLLARSSRQFAMQLYRYLTRCRQTYDVVHVHGFGAEAFAAIAARRVTGKPLIIKHSTAGPGTRLELFARLTRALPFLALAWKSVDAWVSISDEVTEGTLRLGVDPAHVVKIPNGVDTSVFHPLPAGEREAARALLGIRPEERVICTACRLAPHKRVDLLVRAFLQIVPEFPTAQLWIMGKGDELPRLQELAAASPHGSQVRLLGLTPPLRLARTFQAADAFALLSLSEGLSNALIESQACGLPAVVSRASGMTEVIAHGENGFVVPPDDLDAASAALRRLLEDDGRRREMGRRAAGTVQTRYALENTAGRLLALYEACLASVQCQKSNVK